MNRTIAIQQNDSWSYPICKTVNVGKTNSSCSFLTEHEQRSQHLENLLILYFELEHFLLYQARVKL